MKKLIIAAMSFVLAAGAALAQTGETTRTLTGAVVDENGNPLPGATVTATGGAETAVVDADGTFTIEVPIWLKSLTASYPGLGDRKLKTNSELIFTLKQAKRTQWFLDVVGAGMTQINSWSDPEYNPSNIGQLGLMFGVHRSWGAYMKMLFRFTGGGEDYWGDSFGIAPTVTLGVIKRINKNVNVFLGAGVGASVGIDEYYNGAHREYYAGAGGVGELGVMWKFCKRFNVLGGVTYTSPCEVENDGNLSIFFGLGVNL